MLCLSIGAFALDNTPFASGSWQFAATPENHKHACFQIAIKHDPKKLAKFEQVFWDVTNPDSEKYGQYLSIDDITALIGPSDEQVAQVTKWLDENGVTNYAPTLNKDFVRACMPIQQARDLLQSDFALIHHESGAEALRATAPIVVPQSVAEHVDFVGGANTPVHLYNQQARAQKTAAQALADAPATKEDKSPHLIRLLGGKGEISVAFAAYCSNGQLNADAGVPCTKTGGVSVNQFLVLVETKGHGERTVLIPNNICVPNGGECLTAIGMVRDYSSIRIKIQTEFTDGSRSAWSDWSHSVHATDYATPTFLKNLYGIPVSLKVKNPTKATQSVPEFLEQYYNQADLDMYLEEMGLPRQQVTRLIGPNNATQGSISGGESQLDIQVIMGIAVGADTWFVSLPGRNHHTHEEPFLTWVMKMSNMTDAPLVNSVSYADDEGHFTAEYLARLNLEFMKLGARGISVLFASGDNGIGSENISKDPSLCRTSTPSFPSSSPYVTSVGGTQLTDEGTSVCSRVTHGLHMGCTTITERGCSSATGGVITSGGGFSNAFPRPAYQNDHVQNYLSAPNAQLPKSQGFFNPNGRAYPDISAYSNNYITIMGGELSMSSGTSASTPLIAAMFTLWNDMLISAGKPVIGFANPMLYKLAREHPEVFNDVVIGSNNCAIYGAVCCDEGFAAAPGWDAMTGLGSPRFLEIASLLLNPKEPYPFLNSIASIHRVSANVLSANQSPSLLSSSTVGYASLLFSLAALLGSSYLLYRQVSGANKHGERAPLLAGSVAPASHGAFDGELP